MSTATKVEEVHEILAARFAEIEALHGPEIEAATEELNAAEEEYRQAETRRHRAIASHTGAVLAREDAKRLAILAPEGGKV